MPDDEEGLENLAKYIVRAPISQERMLYISSGENADGTAQVIYTGKNSKIDERFSALDWLARLACKANRTENCELYSIYGGIGIVDSTIFQMIS